MKSLEKTQLKSSKFFKLSFKSNKKIEEPQSEEMETMESLSEFEEWSDSQMLLKNSPKLKRRVLLRKSSKISKKLKKPLGKLCSKVGKLFN